MKRYLTSILFAACFFCAGGSAVAQGMDDGATEEAADPAPVDTGTEEAPATEEATPTPEEAAPADNPVDEAVDSEEAVDKEQTNPAEDDLTGFAGEVRQKFKDRDWAAAFAGILMILIALLRKFGGKLSGWFKTKRGGWALNFGSAFGLTVALAFWTGMGWSWGLIPAAFGFGLAASGGYKAFKDITGWLFNRDADDDSADDKPAASADGE